LATQAILNFTSAEKIKRPANEHTIKFG